MRPQGAAALGSCVWRSSVAAGNSHCGDSGSAPLHALRRHATVGKGVRSAGAGEAWRQAGRCSSCAGPTPTCPCAVGTMQRVLKSGSLAGAAPARLQRPCHTPGPLGHPGPPLARGVCSRGPHGHRLVRRSPLGGVSYSQLGSAGARPRALPKSPAFRRSVYSGAADELSALPALAACCARARVQPRQRSRSDGGFIVSEW